jgi:3'(2'), 5'-bisphosphate nucleotidase
MAPKLDGLVQETMTRLALAAGARQMVVYATNFAHSEKDDGSPVTQADEIAEEIIVDGLRAAYPSIPVIAEEEAACGATPKLDDEFFLVDPLDGTKEFISRNGEFTVNIALIRNSAPVVGVVYAPALGKLYAGRRDHGATLSFVDGALHPSAPTKIFARKTPKTGLVAVASRSHRTPETDEFLQTLGIAEFAMAGSSLKFCLIAEGLADVYPRLARTMEWDTAAGQAVLEAAGGEVVVHGSNAPLRYGKKDRGFDNPHFIAWGAR